MENLLEKLKDIVSWHKIEFPQEALDYGWVFLLLLLKDTNGEDLLKDISAPSWVRESYKLMKENLHNLISKLQKAQRPSEIYLLLKGKPTALLLILMLYQKEKVKLYMERLRFIKVDVERFKHLKGKELGEAIEMERLRLIDTLTL